MSSKHKDVIQHNHSFCLYSPSFEDTESIPLESTDFGDNISPELCWHGIPSKTQSYVLIMDSPTAQTIFGKTFVHWMIINIPRSIRCLQAGVDLSRIYNSTEITNDFGLARYHGPCPTDYSIHIYRFTLFAMAVPTIDLRSCLTLEQFEKFMRNNIIGKAQLVAKYKRPSPKGHRLIKQDLSYKSSSSPKSAKNDDYQSDKHKHKEKRMKHKKSKLSFFDTTGRSPSKSVEINKIGLDYEHKRTNSLKKSKIIDINDYKPRIKRDHNDRKLSKHKNHNDEIDRLKKYIRSSKQKIYNVGSGSISTKDTKIKNNFEPIEIDDEMELAKFKYGKK